MEKPKEIIIKEFASLDEAVRKFAKTKKVARAYRRANIDAVFPAGLRC